MFEEWFATEEQAREYVTAVRFRNGTACGRCGSVNVSRSGPRGWWCQDCRHHQSMTTGTLHRGTKQPMQLWLAACWHMTQSKPPISATTFSQMYDMTYDTAWVLLHKIRRAMERTGKEKLDGLIGIDETVIGAREVVKGKTYEKKHRVIVACEVLDGGTAIGRARLQRAHGKGTVAIGAFIAEHIEPGSVLFSDGNEAYVHAVDNLAAAGADYKLDRTVIKGNPAPTASPLLHIHRVISLTKRWLLGTHRGAVNGQHLDACPDEYTFRFNRRNSRNRGLLFYRLICALTAPGEPVSYADVGDRKAALAKDRERHHKLAKAEEKRQESAKNKRAYA